jgi:hypothetical protein
MTATNASFIKPVPNGVRRGPRSVRELTVAPERDSSDLQRVSCLTTTEETLILRLIYQQTVTDLPMTHKGQGTHVCDVVLRHMPLGEYHWVALEPNTQTEFAQGAFQHTEDVYFGEPGACRYCGKEYDIKAIKSPVPFRRIFYYCWSDTCCAHRAHTQAARFDSLAKSIETRVRLEESVWRDKQKSLARAAKSAYDRDAILAETYRPSQALQEQLIEAQQDAVRLHSVANRLDRQ